MEEEVALLGLPGAVVVQAEAVAPALVVAEEGVAEAEGGHIGEVGLHIEAPLVLAHLEAGPPLREVEEEDGQGEDGLLLDQEGHVPGHHPVPGVEDDLPGAEGVVGNLLAARGARGGVAPFQEDRPRRPLADGAGEEEVLGLYADLEGVKALVGEVHLELLRLNEAPLPVPVAHPSREQKEPPFPEVDHPLGLQRLPLPLQAHGFSHEDVDFLPPFLPKLQPFRLQDLDHPLLCEGGKEEEEEKGKPPHRRPPRKRKRPKAP